MNTRALSLGLLLLLGTNAHAGFFGRGKQSKAPSDIQRSSWRNTVTSTSSITLTKSGLYPFDTPMMRELQRIETLSAPAMARPAAKLVYKVLRQGIKAGESFAKTQDRAKLDEAMHCLVIIEELRSLSEKNGYPGFLVWYGEQMVTLIRERVGLGSTDVFQAYHQLHPEMRLTQQAESAQRTIMMPNGQLRRFDENDTTDQAFRGQTHHTPATE